MEQKTKPIEMIENELVSKFNEFGFKELDIIHYSDPKKDIVYGCTMHHVFYKPMMIVAYKKGKWFYQFNEVIN